MVKVKNLPAMSKTGIQSLGWEDPLEKGMATYSSQYSCLGNPMDRGAWQATVQGVPRVKYNLVTKPSHCLTAFPLSLHSFTFLISNGLHLIFETQGSKFRWLTLFPTNESGDTKRPFFLLNLGWPHMSCSVSSSL